MVNNSGYLGIDIGSTNVKFCFYRNTTVWSKVLAHEGDVTGSVKALLDDLASSGDHCVAKALVTGTEGRRRLLLPETISEVAIESGLKALGHHPRAVVSMGGEDLVVYTIDKKGRITSANSGNKCASGTGEFFRQQLGRMDIPLGDLDRVVENATAHRLSARCSVFMKSDCTHRLNKGECTVGDIALSLSKVMADKVSDLLTKARVNQGEVILIGGVTQNRHLVDFLKQAWPEVRFIVPEQSACFEAFGAALLAEQEGRALPEPSALFNGEAALSYGSFNPLADLDHQVRNVPSIRGSFDPQARYILGVDGGSTTTKIALVNTETLEIVAEHYGRTHGDPVNALKGCIREVIGQLGGAIPEITMVATTGSSRELLGVFVESPAVFNEIIAHTVGTTFFEPQVDTIFEIGGQDAKYVYINNCVPIDYAMNEACSAGTGSFLEESARGDLNIEHASQMGPVALSADAPLKFGEHCSAFINSDIRKAIQQGAGRENIVAGLIFSVVANYLNRVVGNRQIGEHIVLQGGVAKNPAVPLAFAQLTGKSITVAPDPELMGCFGVALLAKQKCDQGLLEEQPFQLDALLSKEITHKGAFTCKSCDNLCEIRKLQVSGRRYPFGGRCSKFTNIRKRKEIDQQRITDYTEIRAKMLFEEYAPDPATFVPKTDRIVGIPMAFSTHSLWPFYAGFFHHLGVRAIPSTEVSPKGIAKLESNYCFPAEIAHGAIQNTLDQNVDYVFLPLFKDMPTMEDDPVHACVCPLTQGLPFFARQAFDLDDRRALRPVVSFKHGWEASKEAFEKLAEQLGFSKRDGARAYDLGIAAYRRFLDAYQALGLEVLEKVRSDPDTLYVALLGRPYNAFTRDANMGIPRKIMSNGVSVIPFDMIFDPDAEIFPNMYWYYGQQNMKAVKRVKEIPNLYLTWISNFSCAPDSFMLHYVRWMMGRKPYLVLEIDSHSADAGLDTRIEAFLDIVTSYRNATAPAEHKPFAKRYQIERKSEYLDVVDLRSGEKIDIRDPRVTLVFPSMGDLAAEAACAGTIKQGIKTVSLPVPDAQTTQLARNVASGKECIPSLLVLGSILQFLNANPPNREGEIFLFFVPSTLGPCRTGQYYVFYERLFEDLGWENALVLISGSETSYREMGPTFNRDAWLSMVLGDYFTDIRTGIALMARDVPSAMVVFKDIWREIIETLKVNGDLDPVLARAERELSAIPRRRTIEEIERVLVVGEIYVRRDTFSVQEITEFLIAKGIFPKVTGITEWISYTDFSRKYLMDKQREREGLWHSLKCGLLKEKAWFRVEKFYKEMVEHKVSRHLSKTGFIPPAPHDMKDIVARAEKEFIDPEIESEATVSSGVASAAMADGYSGVVIIAPFACLPGRLIEGVFAPWARARGYPVIALENDGQPYPPSTQARMEIFAHNVLRFERTNGKPSEAALPPKSPSKNKHLRN